MPPPLVPPVAFVLGGGGRLGAAEVGMLGALAEAGVEPDLIVGTSIGAINGAVAAAEPGVPGAQRLRQLWDEVGPSGLLGDGVVERIRRLRQTRVSLHSAGQLAEVLGQVLGPDRRIEDLAVDFSCVAARIETASAVWFDRGPLIPALLASSAVPGLFEPVRIGGAHYLDGGLVDSIPLGRAVSLGAKTVFVLQVGRIEQPLERPTNPAEVAQVAFEIARRHGFATVMQSLPTAVSVHVLPSGGGTPRDLRSNLRYRNHGEVAERVDRASEASRRYLQDLLAAS